MGEALFRKEKDGVRCLACSWYCYLREGQTGVCGVRENIKGEGKLLTYGKVYGGLAVDPIEKKPFYHFLPGSKALSFGTMGCNFGCLFCQNWEMSQKIKNQKSKIKNTDQILKIININSIEYSPEEIVGEAIENDCKTIAYTYNEPAVFVEFAYDTMKLARKAGLKNVFVSNGYESKESFELVKDYLDGINIDLKGPTEEFYRTYCRARIGPVLTNIERFYKAGVWVEVTTMLIEGVNDSVKDIKWITKFLKNISHSIPWHLSAMHPDYKMRGGRVTPYSRLERAYKIGREAGLKYVYAYTTEELDKQSLFLASARNNTYCPKCGNLLIERNYFESEIKGFKAGKCEKCDSFIDGVWV